MINISISQKKLQKIREKHILNDNKCTFWASEKFKFLENKLLFLRFLKEERKKKQKKLIDPEKMKEFTISCLCALPVTNQVLKRNLKGKKQEKHGGNRQNDSNPR